MSVDKTECLVLGSKKNKYLGVIVDRDGIGSQNIRFGLQKARKALNYIYWNERTNKINKNGIGQWHGRDLRR